MSKTYIAQATIRINAPVANVWDALINPEIVKQYFFGTTIASSWKVGEPITFSGVWEGKEYQDKGVILKFEPEQVLEYTHYSAMTGEPDSPENYHGVKLELVAEGAGTTLTMTQDKNKTEDAAKHSTQMWGILLGGLKKLLEYRRTGA